MFKKNLPLKGRTVEPDCVFGMRQFYIEILDFDSLLKMYVMETSPAMQWLRL